MRDRKRPASTMCQNQNTVLIELMEPQYEWAYLFVQPKMKSRMWMGKTFASTIFDDNVYPLMKSCRNSSAVKIPDSGDYLEQDILIEMVNIYFVNWHYCETMGHPLRKIERCWWMDFFPATTHIWMYNGVDGGRCLQLRLIQTSLEWGHPFHFRLEKGLNPELWTSNQSSLFNWC